MTLASPWFSPSGAFFGLARIMSAMDTPAFFFGGAKAGRFLTKRSIEAVNVFQWSMVRCCVSAANGGGYGHAIEPRVAATSWTFPATLARRSRPNGIMAWC